MSAHGPLLARFEASIHDVKTLAYVRAACGAGALCGSLAMMLGKLSVPVFLVALLGLLMSLVWLRQARKLLRSVRTAKPAALAVHRDGIMLEERDWFLPFADVSGFAVDEERMDVRVTLHHGDPLHLEPQYQGVDIYTLVRTLEDARRAAQSTGRHGSSEE